MAGGAQLIVLQQSTSSCFTELHYSEFVGVKLRKDIKCLAPKWKCSCVETDQLSREPNGIPSSWYCFFPNTFIPALNTANILRLTMLSFRLVGFMIVNYISYPAKCPCQTTQQSAVFPIIWWPGNPQLTSGITLVGQPLPQQVPAVDK